MIRSRAAAPLLAALALLVGGGPAFASAAVKTDSVPGESVVVTGTGEASGNPDALTAAFAVQTTAKTVGQALNRASTAATRMRDALVHAGIAGADLQTSTITIGSNVNDDQAITGYSVSQGLTAKIRNLGRAGEIISAAVAAGGDAARLNGASFAVEDDAALLAEARRNAFADARQAAELYAHEAGRPLGRVIKVSETAPTYYSPIAMDAKVPVEPGRQRLSATVTVEWALGPR